MDGKAVLASVLSRETELISPSASTHFDCEMLNLFVF
jgi:hypothetical protein